MWCLVLVVLVACSGVPRSTSATTRALGIEQLIAASQRGDAKAIERLLGDRVVFGGMWFPDAKCTNTFPDVGTVTSDARSELARCLATIKLEASRDHMFPEVAVLSYQPGFEIEVQFDPKEPLIRWIGYVSRASRTDAWPTISNRELETRRLSKTFDDVSLAALSTVYKNRATRPNGARLPFIGAWLKLCIDANGAVMDAQPRAATSADTLDAFIVAAKRLQFRTFTLDGVAIPVCSVVFMIHPGEAPLRAAIPPQLPDERADAVLVVPSFGGRIHGSIGVSPNPLGREWMRSNGRREAEARLMYCIDESGQVDLVRVLQSSDVPGFDVRIATMLRNWRHEPVLRAGKPVKACSYFHFTWRS